MTAFDVPQSVRDNQQKRALASSRPQPCGAGVGNGLTCGQYPTSLYPRGHRCVRCATAEGLVVGQAPGAYPEFLRARRTPTPAPAAVTTLASPEPTLTDRFHAFHQANPHVYARLVELVADEVACGATRIGVGALFERLRYSERTETNGDRYRLNNDLRADYVRHLIAEHPEWADFFETRQRRSA